MLATDIPSRISTAWGTDAAAPYIRTIPITTGDPTAASFDLGWPPATATPVGAGGTPPDVRDANGILKIVTQWERYLGAGGPIGYDATFSTAVGGYPKGAVLASATLGNFWYSTVDNNTSNPDSGGANWVGYSPLPTYATDTSGSGNSVVISLPQKIANLLALKGTRFTIKKNAIANTGAVTLTATLGGTSLGAQSLVTALGTALQAGDLNGSVTFTCVCDGTKFILQSATGTAATKDASDATKSTVASVSGSITVNHVAQFADTAGTIKDGGVLGTAAAKAASNNSLGTVASVYNAGGITANNIAIFRDTSGTVEDSGVLAPQNYTSNFQAFAHGNSYSLGAHGITGTIFGAMAYLKCISPEHGYSAGQIVATVQGGDDGTGVSIVFDATDVWLIVSTIGINIFDFSTQSRFNVTVGDWQICVRLMGGN